MDISDYKLDVIYLTKVRIFKQITTEYADPLYVIEMLFTLQRYEFLSKSQPKLGDSLQKGGCYLPYKGTNF